MPRFARTHGLSQTREYNSWAAMWDRCTNDRHPLYHRYGGRGIRPCGRWRGVETFVADMGPRPVGMTLDRKDNEKGYLCGKCERCVASGETLNCRWATRKEQACNSSTYKGGRQEFTSERHRRRGHLPRTLWGKHRAVLQAWRDTGSLYTAFEIESMCADVLEEAGLTNHELPDSFVADNYAEPPMIDGDAPEMTLAAIGAQLGCTGEWVRRIEAKAIGKMRAALGTGPGRAA